MVKMGVPWSPIIAQLGERGDGEDERNRNVLLQISTNKMTVRSQEIQAKDRRHADLLADKREEREHQLQMQMLKLKEIEMMKSAP